MHLRKLPIPFYKILLTGICLGIVLAMRSYVPYIYWEETEYFTWERFVWPPIINYSLWPLFVPFLYHLMGKYPLIGKASFGTRMVAIFVWVSFSFFHEISTYIIWYSGMYIYDGTPISSESLNYVKGAVPSATVTRMIEYLIIYGLFSALDYYNQYRSKELELAQVESELNEARLTALKRQLQPHFLFNTLNSISSLMEVNVGKAQGMVARLGDLLRAILDQSAHLVSIRKELTFIQNYLDIEETRFEDRLKVVYDIDEGILNKMIPFLITQPLVENAIKHGLSGKSDGGVLQISIQAIAGKIHVVIADNGNGLSRNRHSINESIGITNVRRRLIRHYQDKGALQILENGKQGVKAVITFPDED